MEDRDELLIFLDCDDCGALREQLLRERPPAGSDFNDGFPADTDAFYEIARDPLRVEEMLPEFRAAHTI